MRENHFQIFKQKQRKFPFFLIVSIRWISSDHQMRDSSPSESHFSADLFWSLFCYTFTWFHENNFQIDNCQFLWHFGWPPASSVLLIVSLTSTYGKSGLPRTFRGETFASKKYAHDSLEKLIKIQHLVGHRSPSIRNPIHNGEQLSALSFSGSLLSWVSGAKSLQKRLSKYDLELDEWDDLIV